MIAKIENHASKLKTTSSNQNLYNASAQRYSNHISQTVLRLKLYSEKEQKDSLPVPYLIQQQGSLNDSQNKKPIIPYFQ